MQPERGASAAEVARGAERRLRVHHTHHTGALQFPSHRAERPFRQQVLHGCAAWEREFDKAVVGSKAREQVHKRCEAVFSGKAEAGADKIPPVRLVLLFERRITERFTGC